MAAFSGTPYYIGCMYVCMYLCVYMFVRMFVFTVAELCLHICARCKKTAGAQLRAIQSHPSVH